MHLSISWADRLILMTAKKVAPVKRQYWIIREKLSNCAVRPDRVCYIAVSSSVSSLALSFVSDSESADPYLNGFLGGLRK